MAEHTPEKRGVTGSTPVSTTPPEPISASCSGFHHGERTDRFACHVGTAPTGETDVVSRMLRWSWLLAVVVITLIGSGPHVAAQSAGNGLEERSVNSFEFDPDRGVVRVTIDITLQNVTTDRIDGDQVNRTFFDGYFAAVPLGAENIVATQNGRVLTGELISNPEFPAFSTYRFPLDIQLFSGQSANVQVSYDHLGAPPRDSVPWRINEAYAGFVALGIGDEGLVTLRISQPAGYEFDEFTDLTGFDVGAPDEFGTVVYTRAGLNEDALITVGMANDDRLISRPLDVDGVDLELRSWPDDPEWADFAVGRVEAGIPALEELIGANWPVDGSFTVRETVEPNLRGYAGWFDAQRARDRSGRSTRRGHDLPRVVPCVVQREHVDRALARRGPRPGLRGRAGPPRRRRGPHTARSRTQTTPPLCHSRTGGMSVGSALPRNTATPPRSGSSTRWSTRSASTEPTMWSPPFVTASAGTTDTDRGQRPDDDWKRIYDMFVEVGRSVAAGDLFIALASTPTTPNSSGRANRPLPTWSS